MQARIYADGIHGDGNMFYEKLQSVYIQIRGIYDANIFDGYIYYDGIYNEYIQRSHTKNPKTVSLYCYYMITK